MQVGTQHHVATCLHRYLALGHKTASTMTVNNIIVDLVSVTSTAIVTVVVMIVTTVVVTVIVFAIVWAMCRCQMQL